MRTKTSPATSEVMHKSTEPTFHYSPLSTFSDQDSSITATFQTLSTAPIATSSHLQTTVPSPAPPDSEVGLWFKIIVLVWLSGLLAISILLYVEEVWPRKATTRASKGDPEDQENKDESLQSPTTALEGEQKDVQELRKRKVKNGETVVVGNLGSESRPPDRYAEPTADIEAYTPWKFTSLERAEVGLGIQNIGLSRPSSPEPSPMAPPVTPKIEKDDEQRVSLGCFSQIIEKVVGLVARKWRTEVGEDAEEGLLLPVRNEERGDGEIGNRWMAPETTK